jgi:hypothetical protein
MGDAEFPFLCLDTVEPEELRWYIHNRESRSDHISYLRFFKTALKHVEQERAEEADTRRRLKEALEEGGIASGKSAEEIVSRTVVSWRAAKRGQKLPRHGKGCNPADWESLLNHMYFLAGEGDRQIVKIEEFVRKIGLEPLRAVVSGKAKIAVYAAPKSEECDDRIEPHAWVHRIQVERNKSGFVEKSRKWTLLPGRYRRKPHCFSGIRLKIGSETRRFPPIDTRRNISESQKGSPST